jgi:hypothetical protein
MLFLLLCPSSVKFDKDTNRAAIGIEGEYNGKTVMIRLNCKNLLCKAKFMRNAELRDELMLDLHEAMKNNQEQCDNGDQ